MNIIYFVPNITIAGGIFRIVSDKMNYLAENMEERLFWRIMVMDRRNLYILCIRTFNYYLLI